MGYVHTMDFSVQKSAAESEAEVQGDTLGCLPRNLTL